MNSRVPQRVFLIAVLLSSACQAPAQTLPAGAFAPPGGTAPFDTSRLNMTMLSKEAENELSPLAIQRLSVSQLDLKAPSKARREYEKGAQLLAGKRYEDAIKHLNEAIAIYLNSPAAHVALGSAYSGLKRYAEARDEFARAILLDDHLPTAYLNLGYAELDLKNYQAAEDSLEKASQIAPLDPLLLTTLAYSEVLSEHYSDAIKTAHQVHSRKHKGASIVHFYAASAAQAQDNLELAQSEVDTLLKEDPKSEVADHARQIVDQIKADRLRPKQARVEKPLPKETLSISVKAPADGKMSSEMQNMLQATNEQEQIAEAEVAVAAKCSACEVRRTSVEAESGAAGMPDSSAAPSSHNQAEFTLRSSVHEVAVFFTATDHGNSVLDLTRSDVKVQDDRKAPATLTGFLSESQLPLRLGVVIDTSESITSRFAFEQRAAANFLKKVVTNQGDMAFVVGFSNSILLVQDFTSDHSQISHGISLLAPAGGTALWDAVAFAAEKLSAQPEPKPVARLLVVISDGQDNSSGLSLREAIEAAERAGVFVYTVSTAENVDIATAFKSADIQTGNRALKVLADGTGGTAFFPGSLGSLNHSLSELQQVIRSRYLVSYKPDQFRQDGRYHSIEIAAQKNGRKLRVYARKGYYAGVALSAKGEL